MNFEGKHPTVPGPPPEVEMLDWAEGRFLLVTTGVERLSGAVHGPMAERWLAGEALVVEGMRRIAELGRIGADAFRSRDWDALAEAMAENHSIVATLGGSGAEIDHLIGRCMASGARAAKLAGAGLGGTVIALADDVDDLEARLRIEGYSRFMRPSPAPGVKLES